MVGTRTYLEEAAAEESLEIWYRLPPIGGEGQQSSLAGQRASAQPGPAEPEHTALHGSGAQAGSTNPTQKESSVMRPSQGAVGGQAPARRHPTRKPEAQSSQADAGGGTQSATMDFNQALEQQITQAIQPVLDEFRQRMAQDLSGQMASLPRRGTGKSSTSQGAHQVSDTQASTTPTEPPPKRQTSVPPTTQDVAPQERKSKQTLESQPQPALLPVRNVQHAREQPLSGALTAAVQAVGRSSAQWLQSLLAAGLGALLAESTHTTIQQRAEQDLHTLLQKAFEAAPVDFANQELREKVERTLQLILREALDAVFTEGVRASVQQGGQHTLQQALRGDFGGALKTVEKMPQVMLAALIAVLRRHQQTILRMLLALVLFEVGSALGNSEQAK